MEEKQRNEQVKSEELRFAYDQLRKEILLNDDFTLKILGATLVSTGAFMSFAASDAVQSDFMKGILFFVAASIALIGSHQIVDRDRATFIVGDYLRLFLEPDMPYMQWETRLKTLRKKFGYGNFFVYHILVCSALAFTACSLGCFFLLKSTDIIKRINIDPSNYPAVKFWLAVSICIIFTFSILYFFVNACRNYIKQKKNIPIWWKKIMKRSEEREVQRLKEQLQPLNH